MNTIEPKNINYILQSKRIQPGSIQSKQHPPSNPSFKGVENVVRDGAKTLFTEADKEIMNVFSQHYGDVGERLGKKVAKLATESELLKRSSRFVLEEGALSIKEKTIGQSVLENLLFPFINIPLYSASWILKKAENVPFLEKGARSLYNKPLFRIPRKFNELDSKTNIIKGIYDKTSEVVQKFAKEKGVDPEYLLKQLNKADDTPEAKQLVKEASEYIKESLYKVSNKFFDKHTGNYNTAYERPLNRIVSGLVPVAFLANDAYNLSVLCGDEKNESKKEANERTRQEISRVFTTAYIQLLTFGAFTKQVNTIPWFTPLTSAATVLFSEISARKRLGKPILFLSKDKAKEYNQKAENNKKNVSAKSVIPAKTSQNEVKIEAPKQIKTDMNLIKADSPQVFMSFKSAVENKPESKTEQKKEEPRKALINAKTFKKAVGILIAGGFALSFIKNSSYTKNSKVVQAVQDFGNLCKKKLYNPLAFKDFEISKEEFMKLSESLKEVGCESIAEGHEFIKGKYAKETADGIIKMYKSVLPASKAKNVVNSTLDNLKEKGISLTEKELTQISEAIKISIGAEKANIAENKFEYVAKKASEIIQNKKVNLNEEQIKEFSENLINNLKTNVKEQVIQVETKAKPFVDMVTEPFKFIGSALRLPFKITSSLVKLSVSPVEKKAAQAALGKAELTKVEESIHKVITEIYGTKEAKAGKISQSIFCNAMEQFEKKTKPYLKAKEVYESLKNSNASQESQDKAKAILDKECLKLCKYVNTAVEKSFNGVTQSSNKNTDLAMVSKLASSTVTSAFLVADNYNMVMIKSNGEDKENAKEKANERIIQRLSGLFYQSMLINWFNATFRTTYNSSLKGMAAVVIPNSITTEIVTRKSIGMPIGRKSYEELQANEEKNENRKGFLGKYFKFMRLLTGKKPLKDRMPKNKTEQTETKNTLKINPAKANSTNILEQYTK